MKESVFGSKTGIWLLGWFLIAVFVMKGFALSASAQMESASYKIQSDALSANGDIITSAGYKLNFTTGEIATGKGSGSSYNIHAGYQRMQPGTITLSAPADVTFSAGLGGVTGGQREDTIVWTVTTDAAAGYELYVKASTNPALQCASGGCSVGGDTIANYTEASAGVPDYTWSIATTAAEFGFTPEGTHVFSKYLDNGSSACNTGSSETSSRCWYGFTTSNEKVASSAVPNHPTGTDTTVRLRVESGTAHITQGGNYQATITATATAL
ncbi:MAG TPA: hypothetical protein VJB93_01105 [Patescibacteria group bacterium]|nr:hypothetical protein [Patescibacteria group bacterium]